MMLDFKQLVKNRTLENRLNQLSEECAEVVQACMKMQRDDVDKAEWKTNLLEEMADVSIMIAEIFEMLPEEDFKTYNDFVDKKYRRELRRLAEKEFKK